MFPFDETAQKFSMGETKSMYVNVHGIAPYLQSLQQNHVKKSEYVLLFDETLNQDLQKIQMDILIRNWDVDAKCVVLPSH